MNEITEKLKDLTTIGDTFEEFIKQISDVPFGNSDYQNRQAIINDELTPMRAYRHAALRITNRMQALMEAYFELRRANIEIKKIEIKIAQEKDELEKELLQIDIEQKRVSLPYTMKLVSDAIREIDSLWPVIKKMGKVTRESFELEEWDHFKKKVGNAGLPDGDLFDRIEKGTVFLGGIAKRVDDQQHNAYPYQTTGGTHEDQK